MSDYPHFPATQARRAGLIGLAVVLLVAVLAVVASQRREAWWDYPMPLPAAARELSVTRSRLFRWRLWAYRVDLPAEQLLAFYDRELRERGWRPTPVPATRRAKLRRYGWEGLWLTIRCATDSEPGLAVSLLLSDVAASEGEGADGR